MSASNRHFRLTLLVSLAAIAGCGGGTESSPNPPPPPPPPAAVLPATVSVEGGDGQEAEPGAAVPLRPTALVRSAAGAPVPGVTVAFRVDSGGGTLSATSAVTGGNGIAAAGDWTLGPAQGSNVLVATVAGIDPVKFHAQAKYGLTRTLIAPRSVGTGGTTLTYSRPGDPLSGLELVIPGGAYKTATTWSIVADSSITVPLPADFSQVGPVLVVSNGQRNADSLMALTVPMVVGSDFAVAPFFYDPATGTLEGVPLLGRTDSSITLGSRHFSGDRMAIPDRAQVRALSSSAATAFGVVRLVFVKIPQTKLLGTWTSNFLPGRDDWEFVNWGDYQGPGGDCGGMSITAIYYHYFLPPLGAPSLYRRFDKVFTNDFDNIRGIHFVGAVQQDYEMLWPTTIKQKQAIGNRIKAGGASVADLSATWLAFNLKLSGKPLMLDLRSSTAGHEVVVFAATVTPGRMVMSFADPNYPGQTRTLTYLDGVLVPVSSSAKAGQGGLLYNLSFAFGVSADVPIQEINFRWQEFDTGSPGVDRLPAVRTIEVYDSVNKSWGALPDTFRTTVDLLKLRFRCPACPVKVLGASPADAEFVDILNAAGDVTLALSNKPEVLLLPGKTGYFAKASAFSEFAPTEIAFLDGKQFTVHFGPFVTSPRHLVGKPDTAYTFTANNAGLGTPTSKFTWDFGDGTAPQTVTGDSTVTHVFTQAGSYVVSAQFKDGAGRLMGSQSSGADIRTVSARIIEPSGPFTLDKTYAYAYSLGGFPVGTKFLWEIHNGRYPLLPVTLLNDSTRGFRPTEMGTYKIKVTATAPDGTQLGKDSTSATVTSTYPWPTFEVQNLNLGAPTGHIQPAGTNADVSAIFAIDTTFFSRIVRKQTRMYLIYVPKDTFVVTGTVLPDIGVYYVNGSGPAPLGGETFANSHWNVMAKWNRPGACPLRPDDPTLDDFFTHPGPGSDGSIDSQWPQRYYGLIVAPGCGNVNIIPAVSQEFHMNFSGATAGGSFTITYRVTGQGVGNAQRPDLFRWTMSGSFTAVRVR